MSLHIEHIRAALALNPQGVRSDFDLNPEHRARALGIHDQRPAAVLCGLIRRPTGLNVILTLRAAHLSKHAGQVAFPGGKIDDQDASPVAAALREAHEEVGLLPNQADVIGTLDDYLTSTGYRVTPVVAEVDPDWLAVPDPGEVDRVFEPPLDFLMNPANRHRHHHDRNGYRRHYYAMPWKGHYIWGATAGMLKGLSDRLEAVGARALGP